MAEYAKSQNLNAHLIVHLATGMCDRNQLNEIVPVKAPSGFVRHTNETMLDIVQGEEVYTKGLADKYSFIDIINLPSNRRFYFLAGLCAGGHLIRIEMLLRRFDGPCDRRHLAFACRSGRLDIINLIWSRVNDQHAAVNLAMKDAGADGLNIILAWLIEHGGNNFNGALRGACDSGHQSTAREMILSGADNFNECLIDACRAGHLKLVKMMVEHGATNLNDAFAVACARNHRRIMRYLANQGAYRCNCRTFAVANHFWIQCCFI